jgi:hypothetical protein
MTGLRVSAAATTVGIDGLLDEALFRSLEPAVAALARLIDGSLSRNDVDGEPDGFDGIDRRGSIEHLLASEWALATAEPDEFLRRYETRELGYLLPARRQDKPPVTSLVLFDAGPAQLGRPRIGHLACLLVLARRSAVAGSQLRWGTLQDNGRFDVSETDTFARLVAARSMLPSPEEPPIDGIVDHVLVVCGAPMGWPAMELVLVEADEHIDAALYDNRRHTVRRAAIPLPGSDDAIRVLRDPTGVKHKPPASKTRPHSGEGRGVPISNIVFDHNGHKLLARSGDGQSIVVIPAPTDSIKPGRVFEVRASGDVGPVTAAGRLGKSVVLATVVPDEGVVVLQVVGRTRSTLGGRYPLIGDCVIDVDTPFGTFHTTPLLAGCIEFGDFRLDLRDGKFEVNQRFIPHLRVTGFTATRNEGQWTLVDAGGLTWTPELRPAEQLFGLRWAGHLEALLLDREGAQVFTVSKNRSLRALLCTFDEPVADAVAHDVQKTFAVRFASGAVQVHSKVDGEMFYRYDP